MDAERTPLPPGVALLHAFLNTLDLRSFVRHGKPHQGGERLSTPAELVSWLHEQGLLGADVPADEKDLTRAHQLRTQLRTSLERAEPAGPAAGRPTQGVRLGFRLGVAPGQPPVLTPAGTGVDSALEGIALRVVDAVASGTWNRLKMCEAPDCRWVFYDGSRPGRGRWCSADLCGNRMKTRAYRERHR
ncbi:CGNR zinc finger domain-containing protein [Streptomyces sp. 8N706]|uniref:CGNR zinc finger domain-containing protein n=1 Tax=Streptomyces sp. 8N706 TaxID=3457416 RepID=UPI003FD417EA